MAKNNIKKKFLILYIDAPCDPVCITKINRCFVGSLSEIKCDSLKNIYFLIIYQHKSL